MSFDVCEETRRARVAAWDSSLLIGANWKALRDASGVAWDAEPDCLSIRGDALAASPLYVERTGALPWMQALQGVALQWIDTTQLPCTYVDLRAVAASDAKQRNGRELVRRLGDRFAVAYDWWDARLAEAVIAELAADVLERVADARPVVVCGPLVGELTARVPAESTLNVVFRRSVWRP